MKPLIRFDLVTDTLFADFPRPTILLGINLSLIITLLVVILVVFIVKYLVRKKDVSMVPVKITFGKSGSVEYKIIKNDHNVFIAHRIFIELVTRKAALDIDFKNDVIVEIYNSWYEIFKVIRDEIKNVPGEMLNNIKSTSDLTQLTIEILNKGLRPHLTKYQARFRKWYSEEIEKQECQILTPQEIQERFSDYDELKNDMESVSKVLKAYADELEKIFSGNC
jgi:type IV secretory pathway VirB3-like protein